MHDSQRRKLSENTTDAHICNIFLSVCGVGVLFSVEVMSSHFAVRHYCPCFFSAACGALTFHLLSMWSSDGGEGSVNRNATSVLSGFDVIVVQKANFIALF